MNPHIKLFTTAMAKIDPLAWSLVVAGICNIALYDNRGPLNRLFVHGPKITPYIEVYPKGLSYRYRNRRGLNGFYFNPFAVLPDGSPTPAAWSSFGVVLEALVKKDTTLVLANDLEEKAMVAGIGINYTVDTEGVHQNLPAALALAVLKETK